MFAFKAVAVLALTALCKVAEAQNGTTFTFSSTAGGQPGLQLAAPGAAPVILISSNELPGAVRAAGDLAIDFGRVIGTNATVSTTSTLPAAGSEPAIIIGTVGSSDLIDQLVKANQIDVSTIAGLWETYISQVVSDSSGNLIALVIAGSNMQGTIFGIYDISEQIGVSPWYWWSDVPPKQRQYIFAPTIPKTVGPPSVKFRGIFFNDEAPALTNWANDNFPKSKYGNPFTSTFYAKVFELVLRLRANYVWPAMWNGMFYVDDTKNGPLATQYGVYMGTSHTEPMARADKEHTYFLKGNWDWSTNKANVQQFMKEGAIRAMNWSTVWTLGMRGDGDAASPTLTSSSLVEIIKWQESTLESVLGKNLTDIPQFWALYKEVPGYWAKGMDVNELVTLMWTDDNRGNIRRIPTATENQRAGGAGMYYHVDYVGDPRNYKWINTIQLVKTWEQMQLAYERGVQRVWILNVGDLKGLEIPAHHFLAMAYDMTKFGTPDSTRTWLEDWAAIQFTPDTASVAADIMTTYGKLVARRKYEDLSITPFAFSTSNYDEAELNFQEWSDLLDLAQKTHDSLPDAVQASFFQFVSHPVQAGKQVYEIYTKAAVGKAYAAEKRLSTNDVAADAKNAFSADAALTKQYHTMLDGKWNHMMDQVHIGYTSWQDPAANTMPSLSSVPAAGSSGKLFGVGIQGTSTTPDAAKITLEAMNMYMPPAEKRWFDVFLRGKGTLNYAISSNYSFITVSPANGTIKDTDGDSQQRSIISVDWASAPNGSSTAELTISGGSASTVVVVPLNKTPIPDDFQGHVESNGVVSIEASHYININGSTSSVGYITIPDYGRTLAGVKLWPVTAPVYTAPNGPYLSYRFYSFTAATSATVTVYSSSSENSDSENPNKYALSIDDETPVVVQPTPIAPDAGTEETGWDDAVTRNAWVKNAALGSISPGEHELRVWLQNPTFVLTKLVVDLGGVKQSELGPWESYVNSS